MQLKFKSLKQAEKQMILTPPCRRILKQDLGINWKVRFPSLKETDDIDVRWSNFKDAVHTVVDLIIARRRDTCKEQ